MSYGKFLDDWSKKYLRNDDKNFSEITTEEQWISDNRYKELIAFILENWDKEKIPQAFPTRCKLFD